VQEQKFLFSPQDRRKHRHTGHKYKEESGKIFFPCAFISESESEIDAEEKVLPAFFLAVIASMPVFPAVPRQKQEFRFLHKVSVSVSLNP